MQPDCHSDTRYSMPRAQTGDESFWRTEPARKLEPKLRCGFDEKLGYPRPDLALISIVAFCETGKYTSYSRSCLSVLENRFGRGFVVWSLTIFFGVPL